MGTRGSYTCTWLYGKIFGGIPKMLVLCNFLKILMVSDKITRLLELIQFYKQNPLETFIIFTIYQNNTLALNSHRLCTKLKTKIKTKTRKKLKSRLVLTPTLILTMPKKLSLCLPVLKIRENFVQELFLSNNDNNNSIYLYSAYCKASSRGAYGHDPF